MNAQHAPGPWAVEDDFTIRAVESGAHLASVSDPDCFACLEFESDEEEEKCWAECKANARLMAASPDLLEACKAVLKTLEVQFSKSRAFNEEAVQLRDAIMKATGEEA